MRGLALLAALAVAACEPGAELRPIDRLTLQTLRDEGDDPAVVRPVEHDLLARGTTDPSGLRAALVEAGFEVIRLDRDPGREATVVLLSDTRAPTLARQIAWLEANAPAYGYVHTGWGATARLG